jgi:hypothetical protein
VPNANLAILLFDKAGLTFLFFLFSSFVIDRYPEFRTGTGTGTGTGRLAGRTPDTR